MDRGYLGSLNYDIPLNQQPAQTTATQASSQQAQSFIPPLEKDPLAVRGELTDNYFNAYAMLNNYVKDAQRQGLNPFQPDYSQPGGGPAFQTFQKLTGLLMGTANKLGGEFQAEKQARDYLWSGKAVQTPGFDMSQDLIIENPNAITSLNLMPSVEQANMQAKQDVYTQGDEQRLRAATTDRILAQIDQQEQAGLLTPEQAQIQRAGVLQPSRQTHPYLFKPASNASGSGKKKTSLDLAKAIMNQAAGAWADGTYKEEIINGKRYYKSTKFADVVGKKQVPTKDGTRDVTMQIRDWLKDPQTGSVTVRFTDPNEPNQELTPEQAEQLMVSIISSNSKYGGSGEIPTIYKMANEEGLLDESKTFIPQNTVNTDLISKGLGRIEQDDIVESKTYDLLSSLDEVKEGGWFGIGSKTVDVDLPDGAKITIGKDGGKYKIENYSSVINPQTGKPLKSSESKFTTKEEILTFLTDKGYFKQPKQAVSSPQPQSIDW